MRWPAWRRRLPGELIDPEAAAARGPPAGRGGERDAHGLLAGQVARAADGSPVGAGDLAAQVERAYLGAGVARAAQRLQADVARPVPLLGVPARGEPDVLVEAEAVAVLP